MKKENKVILFGVIGVTLIAGAFALNHLFNKNKDEDPKDGNGNGTPPPDLGTNVDPNAQVSSDPTGVTISSETQEIINTTPPSSGGDEQSYISIGDTIYPSQGYVNIRSAPEVDNGQWYCLGFCSNLLGKTYTPDSVGEVLRIVDTGTHIWYEVDIEWDYISLTELLDDTGFVQTYVRADKVTKTPPTY